MLIEKNPKNNVPLTTDKQYQVRTIDSNWSQTPRTTWMLISDDFGKTFSPLRDAGLESLKDGMAIVRMKLGQTRPKYIEINKQDKTYPVIEKFIKASEALTELHEQADKMTITPIWFGKLLTTSYNLLTRVSDGTHIARDCSFHVTSKTKSLSLYQAVMSLDTFEWSYAKHIDIVAHGTEPLSFDEVIKIDVDDDNNHYLEFLSNDTGETYRITFFDETVTEAIVNVLANYIKNVRETAEIAQDAMLAYINLKNTSQYWIEDEI